MRSTGGRALLLAAVLGTTAVRQAPAQCGGDCNGDRRVGVEELVQMVAIAVRSASSAPCAAADLDGDGQISIDELLVGVGAALRGCPADASQTPTPTASPIARSTIAPDDELYREWDRVSAGVCPGRNRLSVLDGLLSAGCSTGRGHEASLTIEVLADSAAARARFEQLTFAGSPTEFKEFPASAWEEGDELPPFQPRHHLIWLADCAVVNARSFNETIYGGVPDARELSTAVLSWVRGYIVRVCPAE